MKLILLAGGSSNQLWPLASSFKPSQFAPMAPMPSSKEPQSLLAFHLRQAIELAGSPDDVWILTPRTLVPMLREQLKTEGFEGLEQHLIVEPEYRGSLASVGMALQVLHEQLDAPPHEWIALLPMHYSPVDATAFVAEVRSAFRLAQQEEALLHLHSLQNEVHLYGGRLQALRQAFALAQSTLYDTLSRGVLYYSENHAIMPNTSFHQAILTEAQNVIDADLESDCIPLETFGQLKERLQKEAQQRSVITGMSVPANLVLGSTAVKFSNAQDCLVLQTSGHRRPIRIEGVENLVVVDSPDGLLIQSLQP